MSELKLYVWTEFSPDFHDGLAFAIAATEEEARKLVTKAYCCEVREWGEVAVLPLDQPTAFAVEGGG